MSFYTAFAVYAVFVAVFLVGWKRWADRMAKLDTDARIAAAYDRAQAARNAQDMLN